MHRFFVAADSFSGDGVTIGGGAARQIVHVLRLKRGDRIVVLDNSGWEYEVSITGVGRETVNGGVIGRAWGTGEPAVEITLCQALIKADKFEVVLQKCTEMGVKEFQPFVSERCVATDPSEQRKARWRAIVREAAEQSGRAMLPVLHPPADFRTMCQPSGVPGIILWERERSLGLSETLQRPAFCGARSLRVLVGPEGGFSEVEVRVAEEAGIVPVGLGRRILRTETAGLVAVSAIMYHWGELG